MISKYHILIFSLVFSACANPSNNSNFAEANKAHQEVVTENEQVDTSANTVVETDLQKANQTIAETAIPEEPQKIDTEKPAVKKRASTIAEQQEAARKIQQELEERNPKPDENQNLDQAVFEKIVKKPVAKKPEIKKASTEVTKATAPKTDKKKGWPAIEFEEMTMVFDTIKQGDIIDHNFIFTNTGSAPLEIKSANVTCGCTRPSYPFIPIEPNEQGRISVTYNSVGKEGFQTPEVTILTNISSKEIVLKMEGYVLVPEKEKVSKK